MQVRSTHAAARAFRSSVPLRPAGGRATPPLHRRREPDPFGPRSHVARRALDHVLGRRAVALDLPRLEALRDLVPMQPGQPALVLDLAPDVAAEVTRSQPRLSERARADRQPVEQLDMHEAATPAPLDQPPRHEPTDGEVRVQTVPTRMPLR